MISLVYSASCGTPEDIKEELVKIPNSIDLIKGEAKTTALNAAVRNIKIANVEYLLSQGASIYLKLGSNGQSILSTAIGAINDSLHPDGKEWVKNPNVEDAIQVFEMLLKHESEKYPEEVLMLDRKSNYDITPMDNLYALKKTDPKTTAQLEAIIEKYHPGYVSDYNAGIEAKNKALADFIKPKKPREIQNLSSKKAGVSSTNKKNSNQPLVEPENSDSLLSWTKYVVSFFGSSSSAKNRGYEVLNNPKDIPSSTKSLTPNKAKQD
ncbi:MAG: hypothetical protein JSS53_08290 [Proteobacteria bacterium]|nr:hypothetical protein [Pseudomonadota bacterium]